jgi:hypothetical protein
MMHHLFKESKMSFIYYVLILMLSYTGPVYAGLQVEKEYEIVEEDFVDDIERYAQAEVEVGELPSGKIKVFTDQAHSTTIVVDKQDCSIMRKKDDTLALGWKFGGLMWGFGPEIKIGHSSGVAWKGDVQRMVAEYQELCTQFNTGRLSQQEYQIEKQQIVQRGYNYARELEKRFKQKKDDMFKEMDRGKYIHLQKMRFFEGCCYYHNKQERNFVVELPVEVIPVHGRAGSEYAFLDDVYRKSQRETRRWQRQQCRQNNYCNGYYVRRHHNHRRQNNHKYYNNRYQNNHRYYNRHQNNKDLNWDIYGNSNGQWGILMEKEW